MNPRAPSLTLGAGRAFHDACLRSDGNKELFLNLPAIRGESPASVFARYYQLWGGLPASQIVHQNVLGTLHPVTEHGSLHRLNGREWPGLWTQTSRIPAGQVFGIQAHALYSHKVRRLHLRDQFLGVTYEDEWASYCVLSGLRPENPRQSRPRQVSSVFDLAEEVLARAHLAFRDVYRTWFYLDDIRSWHGDFNETRNAFFRSRRIFDRPLPVSTEVGASNGSAAAVVVDLWAMRPKCPEAGYFEVSTECLASGTSAGGGSHQRAIAFSLPGQRRLFVSARSGPGTAGSPAQPLEAATRVVQTLEAVQKLLRARGMSWQDTVRGLAYFSRWEDLGTLQAWCAEQHLKQWPVLAVRADLSREDSLFELEMDALRLG